MAILSKKFGIKKPKTTNIDLCEIYTTPEEAGENYMFFKWRGSTYYIAMVATDDSRGTFMHMKKGKSGDHFLISTTGVIPYEEKTWTSAGTYSFTVPAGVNKVRVALCGGGGGRTAGGTSKFGSLISATGGGAVNYSSQTHYAEKGGGSSTRYTYWNGSGGSPNAKIGTTGWALSFTISNGSYGAGKYFASTSSSEDSSGGYSGCGGYNTGYVDVVPGTTYSIVVGGIGTGGGSGGFVYIGYGGDVR